VLTVTDGYCGAGGSSSGAEMVPGVRVRYALNHWDLAIATHNHNMPHVDHDRCDMVDEKWDPRKYARTDIAWFSPECTTWSVARGEGCDYDDQAQQLALNLDDDEPAADESKQRSRFGMETVPQYAAVHLPEAVIVENVTDILKWHDLPRWKAEMHALGYRHRTVVLNSAFAHGLGMPAPQLRDRVYFVFWLARHRAPDFDKWTRPYAWCPTCDRIVRALYVAKPGRPRAMRYGQQYQYRCPQAACRNAIVHPYVLPAAAAIDWTLPSERIGDRIKPLKPKTVARIEAGLRRYARPITLEAAGNTFERRAGVRTWPVDDPLKTLHTTASKALACPPMLVPSGGTWNTDAQPVAAPMRTRTARETEAVVVPPFLAPLRSDRPRTLLPEAEPLATVMAGGSNHALVEPMLVPTVGRDNVNATPVSAPAKTQTARHETALVVPLRNNGVARPADDVPHPTFAAAGTHHALVMRNQTARGDQGQMSTPVDEPLRTVLAEGPRQSLIRWEDRHAVYGYDSGHLRPLGWPLPTQTTVQGDALLGRAVQVDDCTFRMLDVHEIKAGMAFADTFGMPVGAKRDKVRMLGNAVTPPAARDLIAAVAEAITGVDIPLGLDIAAGDR
jgi:DNA (cytosine-5)-methyltransferase 1